MRRVPIALTLFTPACLLDESAGEIFDQDKDGYTTCQHDILVDDCDDTDPKVHPGAVERCDGKDHDCNQKVDDVEPPEGADYETYCEGARLVVTLTGEPVWTSTDDLAGAALVAVASDGDLWSAALGAPASDEGAGSVWLLQGDRDETDTASVVTLQAPDGAAGAALLVRDLDGDGLPELFAGAPAAAAEGSGASDGGLGVWPGDTLSDDAAPALTLLGEGGQALGRSLAWLDRGDGGSGWLAVGAPAAGEEAQAVALLPGEILADSLGAGGSTEPAGSFVDASLSQHDAETAVGAALATGDLDSDGKADLVVGSLARYDTRRDLLGPEIFVITGEPSELTGDLGDDASARLYASSQEAPMTTASLAVLSEGEAGTFLAVSFPTARDGAGDVYLVPADTIEHAGDGQVVDLEGGRADRIRLRGSEGSGFGTALAEVRLDDGSPGLLIAEGPESVSGAAWCLALDELTVSEAESLEMENADWERGVAARLVSSGSAVGGGAATGLEVPDDASDLLVSVPLAEGGAGLLLVRAPAW